MLPTADSYEGLRRTFRWQVPDRYNIGVDVCDRWAAREPGRVALTFVGPDNRPRDYSYGELRDWSNRLANLLRALGVARGDRVAVLLPQAPETAVGHIAAYKLGAIAVPLFALFGPEALRYRLGNSGAKVVLTNREGAAKLAEIRGGLPDLKHVLCIDGAAPGCHALAAALADQPATFEPVDTAADDPAVIIYTSGTTGQPKGALHAHRVLLGHLPGVEMSHDLLPQPGDRIWTPADWAWIGGLLDVLLPALHHGVPVVARRFEKVHRRGGVPVDPGFRHPQRLPAADRAEDDARGGGAGEALAPRDALGGKRRRDAGYGADRVGQAGVRPHHQRVLRPDRVQHDRLVLRDGDAGACGHHGPRRARTPARGGRRHGALSCRAGRSATLPCSVRTR